MNRIFIIALLLAALFSCRRDPPQNSPSMDDVLTGFEQAEEIKEIYYRFPSPDEMFHFINKEGLSFNDSYLLPTGSANDYLESRAQAVNLGVYIADMAYITLFQRQKEALSYMSVIYGLSEKLRISSAFDQDLMKKFQDNFDNPDSLRKLTDIALTSVTRYLISNEKEETFFIVSVGGFVETLYLAFQLSGPYDEGNEIVQRISDQKYVLENLMNYGRELGGTDNVNSMIAQLEPVYDLYSRLEMTDEQTSVSRSDDGKLVIGGGPRLTITPEQYNELKELIFSVRSSLTGHEVNS